jgi:predicted transcriptional regulator with HTH domain
VAIDNIAEKKLNPGHIAHSFKRSKNRKKVYSHLCSIYPKEETKEEISTATGCDERTVLGVLIGDGYRYRSEDALVIMGLATMREREIHGQKVLIFGARSNGEDVNEMLRDYIRQNSIINRFKKRIEELEGKGWKMQL